ncbi:MAG: DNA replication protein DnaC [Clostridia bacterium]|nr:DNA replication protein DnaC [Clostridia bacterium]
MMYDSNVLRRATALLEELRGRRAGKLEEKRAEVCRKEPRIAEIDRELRHTVAEIIAAALRDSTDPSPAIGVVRDKNMSLQAKRIELLTQAGYPEDILDDRPICPKCGDTGWRGAEMCDCLKVLCAREQIRELSSLLNLGEQTFDHFRIDWYSEEVWPGEVRSPRENMDFIYEVCLNYAKKFGRFYFKNLFLSGGTGLGKTFLSACIARTVSENGFSVVYDTASNVFARYEAQKFSKDTDDSKEAKDETRRYLNCDLLILDDLGSEFTTPFVQSALYQIINNRLVAGRQTVISANLTMDDVRRKYTPQVASRLEGEYRVLPFFGEDIRILRKQKL